MNIGELEIEFIGRPHMHCSCLLSPVFLLISAPVFGQSTATDSQTLQALLAEVDNCTTICRPQRLLRKERRFFSTACKARK